MKGHRICPRENAITLNGLDRRIAITAGTAGIGRLDDSYGWNFARRGISDATVDNDQRGECRSVGQDFFNFSGR